MWQPLGGTLALPSSSRSVIIIIQANLSLPRPPSNAVDAAPAPVGLAQLSPRRRTNVSISAVLTAAGQCTTPDDRCVNGFSVDCPTLETPGSMDSGVMKKGENRIHFSTG
ncbi:hypothetical protein NA57DRAFT_56044 [Rhizodiscina lignyota]|uniref:Uncharacterized protein n=1 Tax=Rhizodiscina lignyota TaxID=1504668 RepID=A0A9P4IIX1_9PEZI|nr:hypothetical protein NA57DRAFT_56044 [Rhizodiscina lignyota]